MAKQGWEKGAGDYSKSYPKLTPYKPSPNENNDRDVSKDADRSADVNGGKAGGLR